MTATEHVILVDESDNPIGTAEKLAAHRESLCHRAFSVFILRNVPHLEVLIQQRAKQKYHSPELWTNTCCSHPRPGEDIKAAAERRLNEEMRIKTSLHSLGSFHYIANFNNGLTENEVDHVLVGYWDEAHINPDPNEVMAYRWIPLVELKNEILNKPSLFTPWLEKALIMVEEKINT